jgi:ATP-binding cassette subfamily B multidrug efflux pump
MFKFFENLVDPYGEYEEHDTPPQKLLPFLWGYCRPFKRVFIWTMALAIIVAMIELWLIWAMGWVVDILVGDPSDVWDLHGTTLMWMAVFVLFVRPVVGALQVALLNNAITPNLGTVIRWRAHKHVLRQSVGWFENDFAGRIANRIMQTPPAAGEAVFQVFDAVGFALAYAIGAVIILAQADARLSLPLLLWMGIYATFLLVTVRKVGPASQKASDARSKVTGRVVDSYTNIHSVKMFAHHDHEIAYAKEVIEEARETFKSEMRIYTTLDVTLVALNGALITGIIGLSIYFWTQGTATVGQVATASALALRINSMTFWIMWATATLFRQLGVVAEGMQTIAQPLTLVDAPDAKPLDLTTGKIQIQNLTHHYGRNQGGLQNISLTIAPGEKIGLVGRSGAGKSTFVKLLLRFYDPESGSIQIDGQDITTITQDSLRAQIGMVQQDSALLHRSVRDNILYGRPNASEAEVYEAARQAQAHDFIMELTDPQARGGYDAQVGERGVKLSGGQRQRITLARAILKDAPILLLDEATSALDSEVEAEIQDTLYHMMEGKTVIAIAHRLSTIAQMDRIIVLENGQIVEDGTHSKLLATQGLYAKFWARQSGGFLDTEAAE